MNLADLLFIYAFLPICLIFYYAFRKTEAKNTVLIVFSLIFYARGKPAMVLLLLGFTVVNFYIGRGIEKFRGLGMAKILLAAGLVLDIGLLFGYKYIGFTVSNINAIFGKNIRFDSPAVPLGLSFFTFRGISYLLDLYWEKIGCEKSFKNYLLFISLFPCTVAGPIVRYSTIGDELTDRSVNVDKMFEGLSRICIGLAKKAILAESLYSVVTDFWGESIAGLSWTETWYTVIVYSLYVYFDFSGYSDMAIGLAKLFGFDFEENFNYPFLCTTVSEFWQRWHISLGTFFRDYLLYVPIFGKMRRYGGLFLVWFCTGLWHGASWNYIIWGLYFGVFILIENLLGKKKIKKIPVWVRHIYTKLIIIIGFGIFYFTDIGELGLFFRNIFLPWKAGFSDPSMSIYFSNNLFLLIVAIICTFPIVPFVKSKLRKTKLGEPVFTVVYGAWSVLLLVLSTAMLIIASENPFLYAQF